ncbi:hypothetical protein [Sphingobium sp. YBL2]|uniref:hypothetical protein n=1 Tax=Sphingobium sp. (strain YBL2) TaxID=484429 RepID=UPI00155DC06C|nr:hypothetical protein [Sphingobium sp. YBL2]
MLRPEYEPSGHSNRTVPGPLAHRTIAPIPVIPKKGSDANRRQRLHQRSNDVKAANVPHGRDIDSVIHQKDCPGHASRSGDRKMRFPIALVSDVHHDQIKAPVFAPRFPACRAVAQKAQKFREFDSRRPVIDHQEDIKPAFQKNGLQCSGWRMSHP